MADAAAISAIANLAGTGLRIFGTIQDSQQQAVDASQRQPWIDQGSELMNNVLKPNYDAYATLLSGLTNDPAYASQLEGIAKQLQGIADGSATFSASSNAAAPALGQVDNIMALLQNERPEDLAGVLDTIGRLKSADNYANLRTSASRVLGENSGALDAAMAGRGMFNSGASLAAQQGLYGDVFGKLASDISANELGRLQAAGGLGNTYNQYMNNERTQRLAAAGGLGTDSARIRASTAEADANRSLQGRLQGLQAAGGIYGNLGQDSLQRQMGQMKGMEWMYGDTLQRYGLGADIMNALQSLYGPRYSPPKGA